METQSLHEGLTRAVPAGVVTDRQREHWMYLLLGLAMFAVGFLAFLAVAVTGWPR